MIYWGMIGVVIIALGMVGAFADEGILQVGIDQMTRVEFLPLLRPNVQVHYEGSIDKLGKNADWDWWL
jgi:hypothetical protein